MTGINYRRVLAGGFAAGLVLIAAEAVVGILILEGIPGIGRDKVELSSLGISE